MSLVTASKVLVIALFDRGFFLAKELQELGYETTLLNLPFKQQESTELWSNPFGHFYDQNATLGQKEFLSEINESIVPSGLSVLTPEGPLQFKSPFINNVLRQRGLLPEASSSHVTLSHKDGAKKNSLHGTDYLASQIFTNQSHFSQPNFSTHKKAYNLMVDYCLTESSRRTLKSHRETCRRLGVKVIDQDLQQLAKNEDGTYHATYSQIENKNYFDQVICLVSGYEALQISPGTFKDVYQKNIIHPDWLWASLSFSYQNKYYSEALPEQFFVVNDFQDQWSYQNFLLLKKHPSVQEIKVYFRWPYNEIQNQNYILKEHIDIQEKIEGHCPGIGLTKIDSLNETSFYNYYLFDQSKLTEYKRQLKTNAGIEVFGPEFWQGWDWTSILTSQQNFIDLKLKQRAIA